MREYPWHQRKALIKHHRRFRNLVDFHDITRAWVDEARIDSAANPHLTEEIRLLETVPDARLETLLDDTSPEDLLGRLEYSVWAIQAWTFSTIFGRIKDRPENLSSALEQVTWKQGKSMAERRWNRISARSRSDLRALFLTLVDSPIALSLGEDAFLLKRGLLQDLEFEFRACPHVLRFPEVMPASSQLCALHSAWIRGYLYGLNPRIQMQYNPRAAAETRCSQHWRLV